MIKIFSSLMVQKSKASWLKEGDCNFAFFHRAIKLRKYKNNILSIMDADGKMRNTPDEVSNVFIEYYTGFLGRR